MLHKLIPIFVAFLICCSSQSMLANGGPIDVSLFRKTGNIRLMQKADISLMQEDLTISVDGDYTLIDVEYTIHNKGAEDEILYGFPIDAFEGKKYGDYERDNPFTWEGRNVTPMGYFKASVNDKPIKTVNWVDDSVYTVKIKNYDYQIYRKWYVLRVPFKANEVKTIRIKTKIGNAKRDFMSGFANVPDFSERKFTYHLTPSSKWGNGMVNKLYISIDLRSMKKDKIPYSLSGLDFTKTGDYYYKFFVENFDLKKSDRINLTYDNSLQNLAKYINKYLYENKYFSISSSTNQDKLKYLTDGDPNTKWEAKPGDWIEFKINYPELEKTGRRSHPNRLKAILILNGDYSSKSNYNNSGRLKKIRIVINDSIQYNPKPWDYIEDKGSIVLPDTPYRQLQDVKGNVSIVADNDYLRGFFWPNYRYSNQKVRKVKIIFLDVYNSDDDDNSFAISELYFLGSWNHASTSSATAY